MSSAQRIVLLVMRMVSTGGFLWTLVKSIFKTAKFFPNLDRCWSHTGTPSVAVNQHGLKPYSGVCQLKLGT